MKVIEKQMPPVDERHPVTAIRLIRDYIQYLCERLDFWCRNSEKEIRELRQQIEDLKNNK